MKTFLLSIQIILSIMLTIAILLQAQGSGFGTTWSGGGETYHTKRGLEKAMFYFTIVGIVVFIGLSIANLAL